MTYSLVKVIGFGSTLSCDPTGGTSFTTLGAIVDGWDESQAKAEKANTSILSDKYMTAAPAQVDPGEVSFEIAYDPMTGSSAATLGALLTSGAIANWQTSLNRGGTPVTSTFLGYVSGLGVAVKKAALVTQKVTIQKTGNPGFIGD
jgi:hypothetical protein